MSVVAVGVLVGLAGFLIVSAAAKAVHPRAAAAALASSGVPRHAAHVAVFVGATAEAAVAAGVVLWPHSRLAQAACLALFGTFAVAGGFALWTGRAVECGCLGALRRSTLGWAQIVQLAVVVGAVGMIARHAPAWSAATGAGAFFLVQVAAAALLVAHAARTWRRIRRDRISLASVRAQTRELGLAGQ